MKMLIVLIPLLYTNLSSAQNFSYPSYPKSVKDPVEYILPHWFLKDSTTGDLNGDKLDDMVIVTEYKDTIEEMRPDSMVNTGSPRILLILFKNATTGRYDLVLQQNTFILRYGEGGMDPDAYGKVSITNKVLDIFFEFIRGFTRYKFRYQQTDFYLIGATSNGVSGGQFDGWDMNFSTRKAKHSWGGISDQRLKEKWLTIPANKQKKLKDLTSPFSWQVFPDVYL